MDWVLRGRCWKFGHDVAVDGDMMPLELALARETRPEILRRYSLIGLDPEFPAKVQRGDIIVGGRRFAQGNPHIQGLLGIAAHGCGLVCESIPRGSLRNAVNAGLPLLPHCRGITERVETGDELEVDFASGEMINHTRQWTGRYQPLPAFLLDIVAAGGWEASLRDRLKRRRPVPP
ncbi:3-isopropylmalate dehydratase [Inquilinus sp. OTU3971]|uniref:3-isopropylmalate dehydratase n=1 Tax=Inquilinus sp. OTU3971 TaxID=3043855 RepID=UPI00313AB94E